MRICQSHTLLTSPQDFDIKGKEDLTLGSMRNIRRRIVHRFHVRREEDEHRYNLRNRF
jgi:hypothetical protein